MDSNVSAYLKPTAMIDCAHPAVVEFAHSAADGASTHVDQAVQLYYRVRDAIRYDPYAIDLSVAGMKASATLSAGRGWCVTKAVVLAACCRAMGIPAKLGYADVRNHLSTARMRDHMKTDIFFWHGYTAILIAGRWVKATPAFNIQLCKRFQLKPLEFDGGRDSIFHPFDRLGNKHMEYVQDRGTYSDVPLDKIIETFRQNYGELISSATDGFEADVNKEMHARRSRPVR